MHTGANTLPQREVSVTALLVVRVWLFGDIHPICTSPYHVVIFFARPVGQVICWRELIPSVNLVIRPVHIKCDTETPRCTAIILNDLESRLDCHISWLSLLFFTQKARLNFVHHSFFITVNLSRKVEKCA